MRVTLFKVSSPWSKALEVKIELRKEWLRVGEHPKKFKKGMRGNVALGSCLKANPVNTSRTAIQ